MVEFYFGELVEHVRRQSQLHPRLREFQGEDDPPEDEPEGRERRSAPAEIPMSFCSEGCYWPCEHR